MRVLRRIVMVVGLVALAPSSGCRGCKMTVVAVMHGFIIARQHSDARY